MKKRLRLLSITSVCFAFTIQANAQSDIFGTGGFGHQGGNNSTYYVGWDNTTNFELNIEHRQVGQPIRFRAGNSPSMQILGVAGTNAGFVGMGDYTLFTPQNRLHL